MLTKDVSPDSDKLVAWTSKSLRERDLDNFLLEELQSSKAFLQWFLDRLGNRFAVPHYSSVEVGKNPKRDVTTGQTDLSVAFFDPSRTLLSIVLIESKVADGFQPSQPERYRSEVDAALEQLGPRRAAAVVVAPKANHAVLDHPCFDATIHIEQIVDHLQDRLATELECDRGAAINELRRRLRSRIGLLEALAGKRAYGNWTPSPVQERVDFMAQYRRIAAELAPHLKPTTSTGGKKATSVLFGGLSVPGIAVKNIRHDFGATQCVSLVLANAAPAKSRITASGLLPNSAILDATKSGSLLVRLASPPIREPSGDLFEAQRSAVEEGIRIALRLERWAAENANALAKLISG
jgi:hypothetical protein